LFDDAALASIVVLGAQEQHSCTISTNDYKSSIVMLAYKLLLFVLVAVTKANADAPPESNKNSMMSRADDSHLPRFSLPCKEEEEDDESGLRGEKVDCEPRPRRCSVLSIMI
jgi:hypothetical protein